MILRAGEEIKSLARYAGAQKLGFTKLLKKYKRWTHSVELELRFKQAILSRSDSFTNVDLQPLLDSYMEILHEVRDTVITGPSASGSSRARTPNASALTDTSLNQSNISFPTASAIQDAINSSGEVGFDAAFGTVPLGQGGSKAAYWVHPENIVELQVLLLQYLRLLVPASRKDSGVTTPAAATRSRSGSVQISGGVTTANQEEARGYVVLDDVDELGKHHSSINVEGTEYSAGLTPAKAKAGVRWVSNGDALVTLNAHAVQASAPDVTSAAVVVKRKSLVDFLDTRRSSKASQTVRYSDSKDDTPRANNVAQREQVGDWLRRHAEVRPIAGVCSRRVRFIGLGNNDEHGLWATLDQDISLKDDLILDAAESDWWSSARKTAKQFPYAVLEVRREGKQSDDLLKALDKSHLVSIRNPKPVASLTTRRPKE